ncbi:MAG: hypothetical protein WBD20_25315 [Pirellulaceae bacterium]
MRNVFVLLVVAASCVYSSHVYAQTPVPPSDDVTHIIVVLGAEGQPEFGEQFGQWAKSWETIAKRAGAKFSPIGREAIGDKTDREQLQVLLSEVPQDRTSATWLVLIGHGTYARETAKFNLRGPDVAAKELATWLAPIKSPLVIVNCASSSGPFINRLSANNRVVVTATKSGTEYNYARFGKYFVDAVGSAASDLDHDDEISVQEAFLQASYLVQQFYDSETRIASEHALIDDNGDSRGTPSKMFRGVRAIATAKDGKQVDGRLASKISLAVNGNALALTPAEQKLRGELENQLDQLRDRKADLEFAEHQRELELVMIQLAKVYQAAEKRADVAVED